MENNVGNKEVHNNKYVLAMYDVRGKQEFIFRTNKIKEMVGGSLLIRDLFSDYLYPAAEQVSSSGRSSKGIFHGSISKFEKSGFESRVNKENYVGEVIYDGGGNFFVLYKDVTSLIQTNEIFTERILENIGTLRVICSYIEGVDFNDYKGDERKLRDVHRRNENTETISRPVNALPVIKLDSNTSQPIVRTEIGKIQGKGIPERTTQESYAKLKKYYDLAKNDPEYGEDILDKLVRAKGEDSILGVVFIDGNNMGAKVASCLNEVGKDYESCINSLRKFSSDIQTNYVEEPKKAIIERIKSKGRDHSIVRMVVFAGDEMSFVCRGEDALDAVKAYFESLHGDEDPNEIRSSCAGIALFHSHAPYSEAYKIAEECCENGKRRMKGNEETDTCYIDFQFCQGSLGMDLETIRERETGPVISKPWLYSGIFGPKSDPDKEYRLEDVERIVRGFHKMNARSNIKTLVFRAKESGQAFQMEMERIYAHMKDELKNDDDIKFIFKDRSKYSNEQIRNLIYDIGIVYDQWFKSEEDK